MSEQIAQTAEKAAKFLEFIPYGQPDSIKLSVKIIQDIVAVPTKSGATCSERDAMRFLMLCSAQRLNPFAGDAFLTGYDGKDGVAKFSLITSHVAVLKRAEGCPDYQGMESGIIFRPDKDGAIQEREGDFFMPPEIVVGGWARVYRNGRKPTYRRLSIAAMRPPYDTPFWNADKAPGQIVKCAEADALRSTFPSLLSGLYIEGERTVDIASEVTTGPAKTNLQKALSGPSEPEKEEMQKEARRRETKPAPEPEPEKPASSTEQKPEGGNGEFKPKHGESDALTNVRYLLHKHGKSEEQLLFVGRKKNWAKEGQKLAELSELKLKQVGSTWDAVLKEMA